MYVYNMWYMWDKYVSATSKKLFLTIRKSMTTKRKQQSKQIAYKRRQPILMKKLSSTHRSFFALSLFSPSRSPCTPHPHDIKYNTNALHNIQRDQKDMKTQKRKYHKRIKSFCLLLSSCTAIALDMCCSLYSLETYLSLPSPQPTRAL